MAWLRKAQGVALWRAIVCLALIVLMTALLASCGAGGQTQDASAPTLGDTLVYQPGQTAKGAAAAMENDGSGSSQGASAAGQQAYVDATLTACSRSAEVPPGFFQSFASMFQDNSEYFAKMADSEGRMRDGYAFVQAAFQFTNENDHDCRLSLGNMFLGAYPDGPESGFSSHQEPLWLLKQVENDPARDAKDYFLPNLPAGETASYTLGYIVPTDLLDSGKVGVVLSQDIVGAGVGNYKVVDVTSLVQSPDGA